LGNLLIIPSFSDDSDPGTAGFADHLALIDLIGESLDNLILVDFLLKAIPVDVKQKLIVLVHRKSP
jgi:hypothetical protein